MAPALTHRLGHAPWVPGCRLVVVPTVEFGLHAEQAGVIDDDERWSPVTDLNAIRGQSFKSWRWLNSLDPLPGPGADPAMVEAWLARESAGTGEELDPSMRFQLDAMVLFSSP